MSDVRVLVGTQERCLCSNGGWKAQKLECERPAFRRLGDVSPQRDRPWIPIACMRRKPADGLAS